MNLICKFLRGSIFHKFLLLAFPCLLLLPSCRTLADPDNITSINIIDRNGITETISEKKRLEPFQRTDFLAPQPYQKVLRVYGKEENGDINSTITSYHPNGQIKQYLEAKNNRAFGLYREWHSNGVLKIESRIIGGMADVNTQAEESWLFDGINRAWDDEGHLLATIDYKKGELEGNSIYYHSNGHIWKISPYLKNVLHGTEKTFKKEGELFQITEYTNGQKMGRSVKYWQPNRIGSEEFYQQGLLMEGHYKNQKGDLIAEISGGVGFKALFGKEHLQEIQEFRNGVQEGIVKCFGENGRILSYYSIKEGEKEGEEVDYYVNGSPKISISWHQGKIQGRVKTWYENGKIESQKEICQNQKNGLTTAWYPSGALMLVEEYEADKLIKGEYYRLGEKTPLSLVEKGKGVATLFDLQGNTTKKINYYDGKPVL